MQRSLFIIIYLLALVDLYYTATCPTGTVISGTYTSGAVGVTWKNDCTKKTIQLISTFTGANIGWVSVGWNTNGAMTGGDVAFAWIDTATTTQYILDTTNTNHGTPTADTNTYTNASITRAGTTTTLSFTRAWATADATDIPLSTTSTAALTLMLAYNGVSPTGNQLAGAGKHTAYATNPVNFFQAAAAATTAAGTTTAVAATTGSSPGKSTDPACTPGAFFSGQYANAIGTWQIRWAIDCNAGVFSAVMSAQTSGWVAFGINSAPLMSGSDIFQANVVGGVVTSLDGHSNSQSTPVQAAKNIYTKVNGTDDGKTTTIGFSRPLTPTTEAIITSTGSNLLWAYHATSDDLGQLHTSQGALGLNFFTGASSQPTNYKLIHGSIMVIAWGFLALAGTFVARYLKGVGHIWYRVHIGIQYSVLILTVIGFIMIVNEVSAGNHFSSAHAVLGLFIFLGTFMQVALGILSNRMWKPNREGVPAFPDQMHWWLGRTVILLGVVNVFLGFDLYGYTGVDYGPIIAFSIWVAIVYLLFVGIDMTVEINHVHSDAPKTKRELAEENKTQLVYFGIMLFTGLILFSVTMNKIWDNPP